MLTARRDWLSYPGWSPLPPLTTSYRDPTDRCTHIDHAIGRSAALYRGLHMKWNKANRLTHRWSTVIIALPVLVTIVTGLLLQWKKDAAWIQPPTQRGVASEPTLTFDQILDSARTVDQAGIDTWDDINRLDVRPGKGIVKVRASNSWEVQIDTQTGEVLQVAYRRSDFIESLHDGSWFHDSAKLWIFFPAGVVLLVMWGTGIWLFVLPYVSKRKRRALGRAAVARSKNQ